MCKNTLRNIAYTAAGLALFFKLGLAGAASITFDPLNPTYDPGAAQPISIKVVARDFVANGSATQGSYGGGLSVSWDSNILSLSGVNRTVSSQYFYPDGTTGTFTKFTGDQFFGNDGTVTTDAGTGISTLSGLTIASFFSGTSLANFDIAELLFNFVGSGTSSTSVSISNIDVWTDGSHSIDVAPTGVGGSVTVSAVPLPPALLLFGSSLMGMFSFGRRHSSAA